MKSSETAGQRLVKLLDEGLPSGIVWTAKEQAALTLIEAAADRIETLKALLAAETAKPEVVAHRVCELAGEIRQSEAAIAKLVSGLDPEMTTVDAPGPAGFRRCRAGSPSPPRAGARVAPARRRARRYAGPPTPTPFQRARAASSNEPT